MSGTVTAALYPVPAGEFAGIPVITLQAWLMAAQTALHDLQVGGKPVSVSYAQGDGAKSVTYTAASVPSLRAYVLSLQAALGLGTGRRRPIRPYFA